MLGRLGAGVWTRTSGGAPGEAEGLEPSPRGKKVLTEGVQDRMQPSVGDFFPMGVEEGERNGEKFRERSRASRRPGT